ncbi:cyclin-J [Corythoichthys intestinalis]|uniref:cyclin-J n=1 Tax=Corythoichthys intestinalis TaxID=161448 RepID=UPI0025A57998|nr:cyclin-J [Corythoichthys intestinalis]XP_057704527.1 cyclin-J [Corythoichthys intestinalis]XP_061794579.1 cyclin-J-like [Nerophis lumbriciformis]
MELEDQWWKGQLATDIYQTLRYNELKLPSFKGQSPQLYLRRYFADLIAIISNHFQLCPTARHLAVYLLDLFMDRYDVTVQQLYMVSLSCLLLASKVEEREDRIPKLDSLNSLGCMSTMNLVLTKQALLHMELFLLESFQWNLYLPTAAHFIEYYLSIAVHEGDLHDGWPMSSLEKTKPYMAKYADYFLEVSLQDHAFLCFAPSLVAAACVAASRLILHVSPTWAPRLQRLSGYSWENLVPCAEKLIIAHDSDVKEANKQKCQQPQQKGQTVYHSSSQAATVAQYRPGMQYAQQASQPALAPNLRPASYLTHTATMQVSNGATQGSTQTVTTAFEPKSNQTNRVYQVSMLYSGATCFDR